MWWYCGEFKVTAYQFVTEANAGGISWYGDADSTVTTAEGVTFNANSLFVQDVIVNGTGRPSAHVCTDNYFHAPGDGQFHCGKGKPFDPNVDAYNIVAANLDTLRMGASIYVPGLEDNSDPKGNADFVVRDSGGGLVRDQIDVFAGEGPGILSGHYNDCPGLAYISYHHYTRGVTVFQDADGVNKLSPLALYQKSRYRWWAPCLDERVE